MAETNDCANARKAIDSVYSKSYNSESTRSSVSAVRSGSNSSGSSGYGGLPSSGSNSGGGKSHSKRTKHKESKMETSQVNEKLEPPETNEEKETKNTIKSEENVKEEPDTTEKFEKLTTLDGLENKQKDFTCVVSMQNGIIMYSSATLKYTLGYPQNMWIGRSFIDFVHPKDQGMFASQISNIETSSKAKDTQSQNRLTLYCRLRLYNRLCNTGFEIKSDKVSYLPIKLVLFFYDQANDGDKGTLKKIEGNVDDDRGPYIVIQATVIVPVFKESLQILHRGANFTIRHSVLGIIEHVDATSIPYLGYMPHDLIGNCAIRMYHPEDLCQMRRVYEIIVKLGKAPKTSFRMLTHNGDYVRVETNFTCFVNPWSKKLEYVTGNHKVVQGPLDIDLFGAPNPDRCLLSIKKLRINAEIMRDQTLRIMKECLTKRAEIAKQQMSRKCQNISTMMEKFMEKSELEVKTDLGKERSLSEKGSVLLGGISPHHDYSDSISASTDSSPSYNQMNYKEILQKFFDSEPVTHDAAAVDNGISEDTREMFMQAHCSNRPVTKGSGNEAVAMSTKIRYEFKERNRLKLTESALKKHDKEMELALTKEGREPRHKPDKKSVIKKRLQQRCKDYNDRSEKSEAFVDSKKLCLHSNATSSKISTRRDRNRDSKLKKGKKFQEVRQAKKERSVKRGMKRDSTTAALLDSNLPIKQTKPNFVHKTIYSPLSLSSSLIPSYSPFKSGPELCALSSMTGLSIQTNTFVDTMSRSMGRQSYTAPYSPSSTPPVWSNQNPVITSSVMTAKPFVNAVPAPLLLYPHVYGRSVLYAPTLQSTSYASVNSMKKQSDESAAERSHQQQSGFDESSWYSSNNEQNSGSDQDALYKTEGETSSSFYSSLIKLDLSSDDQLKSSSDMESMTNTWKGHSFGGSRTNSRYANLKDETQSRKMEPPWMTEILPTSELFYKYKLPTKREENVLENDRSFLHDLNQSEEVNNQLKQLYIDLHMQGVTSKLTLEDGITSSGSSGEETITVNCNSKKKRPYSKIAMIFEEDAPFPPPDVFDFKQHARMHKSIENMEKNEQNNAHTEHFNKKEEDNLSTAEKVSNNEKK